MKKYIKAITELNNLTLTATEDEVNRYSESDIYWTKNKSAPYVNRKIRKGDIYQFEFGKNYVPEMSYEHRGMVIGKSGRLVYVLPIFSYNPQKYINEPPCHIIDNPNGKSNYYLMKKSEFSFLDHDSLIKLNDIRTVSSLRIKYSQSSRIDPNTDTYKFIERNTFIKYFANIAYDFKAIEEERDMLKKELDLLKKENEKLKSQI
jgi:signal peptidase I